nr:hypothetical protein [Burkholderia cepacia]
MLVYLFDIVGARTTFTMCLPDGRDKFLHCFRRQDVLARLQRHYRLSLLKTLQSYVQTTELEVLSFSFHEISFNFGSPRVLKFERDAYAYGASIGFQIKRWAGAVPRTPIQYRCFAKYAPISPKFSHDAPYASVLLFPSIRHQRSVAENPHDVFLY